MHDQLTERLHDPGSGASEVTPVWRPDGSISKRLVYSFHGWSGRIIVEDKHSMMPVVLRQPEGTLTDSLLPGYDFGPRSLGFSGDFSSLEAPDRFWMTYLSCGEGSAFYGTQERPVGELSLTYDATPPDSELPEPRVAVKFLILEANTTDARQGVRVVPDLLRSYPGPPRTDSMLLDNLPYQILDSAVRTEEGQLTSDAIDALCTVVTQTLVTYDRLEG